MGAIAGATVGGVLAICIVAVCFFWLRHKHRKQRMLLESQSMYGGMSEKVGPAPYNGSMLDYPNAQVPEHMVPVPFDEYGRPLESVQYSPDGFPLTPGQEPPPQQLHQATAPVGTLPEPVRLARHFLLQAFIAHRHSYRWTPTRRWTQVPSLRRAAV